MIRWGSDRAAVCFTGDDPLNATDPSGLYQSGPGTAACQHQNGTISCTGALPSGQSVTGTLNPSSGSSTGAFSQSTIPAVVNIQASAGSHEGANTTNAIGSKQYEADLHARQLLRYGCIPRSDWWDRWSLHLSRSNERPGVQRSTGTDIGRSLAAVGGMVALAGLDPLASLPEFSGTFSEEGDTTLFRYIASKPTLYGSLGATAGGVVIATVGAISLPATC